MTFPRSALHTQSMQLCQGAARKGGQQCSVIANFRKLSDRDQQEQHPPEPSEQASLDT